MESFFDPKLWSEFWVFFFRRVKGNQRNKKNQEEPWHSSTLSLPYREVNLGHCCLPPWQDPKGPPQCTPLLFSDTYTIREGTQTHSIWRWFNFFSNPLDEVFVSKLATLSCSWGLALFLGPNIYQRCKAEFCCHPLIFFYTAHVLSSKILTSLLFWKPPRVMFKLSS